MTKKRGADRKMEDVTGRNCPTAVRLRNRIKELNEVINRSTEERDALVRIGEKKGWVKPIDKTARKLGRDVVVGSAVDPHKEFLPPRVNA